MPANTKFFTDGLKAIEEIASDGMLSVFVVQTGPPAAV